MNNTKWAIYCATNTVSGKRYVGLTKNGVTMRWYGHTYCARAWGERKRRHTSIFHKAIHRYGPDAFLVETLYVAFDKDAAIAAEREFIAAFGTLSPGGYNLTIGGEGAESPALEVRQRMSAAHKGKKRSPEAVAKTAAANRGKKRSPEAIARTVAANTGRKQTPEAIARQIAARTGWRPSLENRAKQSAAQRGKPRSLEAIRKTADANRGRKNTPETIERMRQSALQREHKPFSPTGRLRLNETKRLNATTSSKSGIKGVRERKPGRWEAFIKDGKTQRHLGTFPTSEAASAAYQAAAAAIIEDLRAHVIPPAASAAPGHRAAGCPRAASG